MVLQERIFTTFAPVPTSGKFHTNPRNISKNQSEVRYFFPFESNIPAMSAHISQSLEKLLFDHETVILPGFGGFTTTKTPATVDYAQGALLPPSRAIVFNENLTVNDGLLVQRLCHDYGFNSDQAFGEVQEFVEKTRNALDQREIITLPGVGRLYKNYAQKVQFLPDNANFNTDSYGLPPLQFSPIMRSREAKEQIVVAANSGPDASAAPQPSATPVASVLEEPVAQPASFDPPAPPAPVWEPEPEASFFQKWMPWIVGLLAIALAIGIWYTQKSKPAIVANGKPVKTENPLADITIGGTPEVLPNKPAAEKTVVTTAETDKPESRKNDDDADVVADYEKQRQAAKKTEKPAAKPAEKTPTAAAAPFAGEGRRAVIIVGTWSDKKTADGMIALLKKNGWDTYFRNEKGWQVGIETTYKDMGELKTHLKTLEAQTKQENIWIKKK